MRPVYLEQAASCDREARRVESHAHGPMRDMLLEHAKRLREEAEEFRRSPVNPDRVAAAGLGRPGGSGGETDRLHGGAAGRRDRKLAPRRVQHCTQCGMAVRQLYELGGKPARCFLCLTPEELTGKPAPAQPKPPEQGEIF